eukprot:CAMPEP_0203854670 /NCGR_PEP_ID=MMETSP0359-20131031/9223_1 /ASSEMBLY_ACC=CAM_ASM_000338 /TAXON_ID=268821 /ORGANISM="Scrippsiella Hangoei, Strain SHTV-5" /LENGTH=53 /DNA_ID=CAMNT_0050771161 /DNA_START=211 /DNA_END=368 /DNA_ORIENTATION=-
MAYDSTPNGFVARFVVKSGPRLLVPEGRREDGRGQRMAPSSAMTSEHPSSDCT